MKKTVKWIRGILLVSLWVGCWGGYSLGTAPAVHAATVVVQDNFESESNLWDRSGDARRTDGVIELTQAQNNKLGYMWLNQSLSPPYTVSFKFRISDSSSSPADGLVFMFNKEKNSNGQGGGSLGFVEGNGYGVEFDTWPNEWDPGAKHITLFKNSPRHSPENLLAQADALNNPLLPNFANSAWHDVRIDVRTNSIKVSLDGVDQLTWIGTVDNSYNRLGFAASTGGSHSRHLIDNVTITTPDSNDATLSSLSMEGQTIQFQPATTSYQLSVPFEVDTARLHFTPDNAQASVQSVESTVSGAVYGVTPNSANVQLSIGPNPITITVKAEDSSTKTYTLNITRHGSNNAYLTELNALGNAILSPSFQSNQFIYEVYVPATEPIATVLFRLSDQNATYSVSGSVYGSGMASSLAAPIPGAPIFYPLNTEVNYYDLKVIAPDHITTLTYRLMIQRVPATQPNQIGYARMTEPNTLELAFPTKVVLPSPWNPSTVRLTGTDAKVTQMLSLDSRTDGTRIKLQLDHPLSPGENVQLSLLQGAVQLPDGEPVLQFFAPVLTLEQQRSLSAQLDAQQDGVHIDDVVRYMQGRPLSEKDFNRDGQFDRNDVLVLLQLILQQQNN
ncbi:cadherin-like beta sandwich domain-containing protein [Paenibacillus sp. HJGM_3]|uniref:lectin-like domain-containing protein n=1 Tax=Paenibacillus sp. HJGM_3 TaxID=3379816 RepID=UPI00385A8A18